MSLFGSGPPVTHNIKNTQKENNPQQHTTHSHTRNARHNQQSDNPQENTINPHTTTTNQQSENNPQNTTDSHTRTSRNHQQTESPHQLNTMDSNPRTRTTNQQTESPHHLNTTDPNQNNNSPTETNPENNPNNTTTNAPYEPPALTTTWGPSLITPRPPHTERIIFQNINGIPINNTECIELFSSAEAMDPSILGLAETKLDCRKHYERTVIPLRTRIKRIWNHHKLTITDSKDNVSETSVYKPGGVMQITTGSTCARIQKSENDKDLGRWTSQTMLHSDGKKSIFYTAYRVCQQTPALSTGTTTACMQQWRIQRASGINNPNPRSLFLSDLTSEIKSKRAENYEVFIMGDFNTPIDDPDLREFMHECDLFDLHEPCATHSTAPATFKHGSKKIDHMFGTYFFLDATLRASILSWKDSLRGDHLCLVIDFCQKKLNSSGDDLTSPSQRKLTASSPRKSTRYRSKTLDLMEKSKIQQRLDNLKKKCTRQGKTTPRDDRTLGNIDNEMTGYMRHAESKCGPTNYGHHSSPALSKAGREITKIKKMRTAIHIKLPWSTDTQETRLRMELSYLETALKNAWINLKACQAVSKRLREKHLKERSEWYASQHNLDAAKAVDIIIRCEKQRNIFRKVRRYLKPTPNSSIDRVLVPDGEHWKEITEADEIYKHLQTQAIKEMNSADGTPFTTAPLDKIIPPWSPAPDTESILNGTFEPPTHCTQEIKDLFTQLTYKNSTKPPTLDIPITIEDWTASIKSKKESTASSPSGRHIGHYKAALECEPLLSFHLDIINFARLFTSPPPRWCTAIQLRLEKMAGMPRIDKLRMIQLIEFDMNAQFGITIGRHMLWNVEDHSLFSGIPQFGARRNRQSPSASLLKRVSFDIIRQLLIDSAVCNNDLEKCYDRVLAGIGMITCIRNGVPKKVTDLKLKILERIRFYTRCAYGLSSTTFGNEKSKETPHHHTEQAPKLTFASARDSYARLFGVGQGTQDAGAIWICLWAIIYATLNMISPGLKFFNADLSESTERKGEAFIDDTDLWVTSTTLANNSISTIIEGITALLQRWHRILCATGGMLGFKKCFWFLIRFSWKRGKPHMDTIAEAPGELRIFTDDERGEVTIQRLEPSHGLLSLGVRLAPDCNQEAELKFRLQQAKDISKLLWNAPLSRSEVTIAHEQIWWPSVGFPLGITTFNSKQCEKLQATFQGTWIAKMGFSRSMAKAIRYGPAHYGGAWLRTIEGVQGQKHIQLALFHLRAMDEVNESLLITLSISQLQAGIQRPILHSSWETYGSYITDTWLTKTWEYLSTHNIQLDVPNAWTPKPQRINDSFIMELAVQFRPTKNKAYLHHIQLCRLYLQVTTISDIVDATGKYLEPNITKGYRSQHRKSLLNFPTNFPRPATQSWTTFRKLLKLLLRDPTNLKSPLTDQYSLGAWYAHRHETWTTNYSPETKRLYVTKNNNITSYGQQSRAQRHFTHSARRNESETPPDVIPISLTTELRTTGIPIATTEQITPVPFDTTPEPLRTRTQRNNRTSNDNRITAPSDNTTTLTRTQRNNRTSSNNRTNYNNPFDNPNISTELKQQLSQLPKWKQQYMENLVLCPGFRTLYRDAYVKNLLGCVSDGSSPHHGSFAWKIVNMETETTLAQAGGVCCHYPGLTSHRMEASGILGCQIFLAVVSQTLSLPVYSATLAHYCDNSEAVDRSNEADFPHVTDFTLHDYDLHYAIRKLRPLCPKTTSKWIKGHQDRHATISELPYPVRLNIEVDALCTLYHQTHPHFLEPPPTIQLYHNSTPITWDFNNFLRFHTCADPLKARILKKHPEWDEATFNQIAWEAIGQSLPKLVPFQRTRIIKFQHRISATLKLQQDRDRKINGRCPNCNRRKDETEDHIIRCQHDTISAARKTGIDHLTETLLSLETPPDLSLAILYGIQKWIEQNDHGNSPPAITWPPSTFTYHPINHRHIETAFNMQCTIGWDEFMRGRICKQWGDIIAQHYYHTEAPSSRNRATWEQRILKSIWKIFDSTWTARNSLIHGIDQSENDKIHESTIDADIEEAYRSDQHNIDINDTSIFHTPMYILIQKSLDFKRAWLKSLYIAKKQWAIEQGADNPIDRGPTTQQGRTNDPDDCSHSST